MADTPTINTSVPQITFTETGLTLPSESDVLTGAITDLNAAFGNNLRFFNDAGTFLPSRPQGQIATTEAAVISDMMGALAYIANSFDPAVASGRIQDGIASINFITRNSATSTTVTCTLTGAVDTPIPAGVKAKDTSGNIYASAGAVTIGSDGTATATFNCTTTGAVACPAGTLTQIYQIVPGWDTITNPTDGVTGAAGETRAEFEARRSASVQINGIGALGAIKAQVAAVSGVIDAYAVDNKTSADTTVGTVTVPAKGIMVAVAGGTDADVAFAIWSKAAGGTPMGGNTSVVVSDTVNGYAAPYPTTTITFQRAISTALYVQVTLTTGTDIPETALQSIQTACLAAFQGTGVALTSMEKINSIVYGSAFVADLVALGSWARIVSVQVSLDGSTWADTVSFNAAEIPSLVAANISRVLS